MRTDPAVARKAGRLRGLGARFTKPVFSDETIRTEYWTASRKATQFCCVSLEWNEVVLDRGYASVVA